MLFAFRFGPSGVNVAYVLLQPSLNPIQKTTMVVKYENRLSSCISLILPLFRLFKRNHISMANPENVYLFAVAHNGKLPNVPDISAEVPASRFNTHQAFAPTWVTNTAPHAPYILCHLSSECIAMGMLVWKSPPVETRYSDLWFVKEPAIQEWFSLEKTLWAIIKTLYAVFTRKVQGLIGVGTQIFFWSSVSSLPLRQIHSTPRKAGITAMQAHCCILIDAVLLSWLIAQFKVHNVEWTCYLDIDKRAFTVNDSISNSSNRVGVFAWVDNMPFSAPELRALVRFCIPVYLCLGLANNKMKPIDPCWISNGIWGPADVKKKSLQPKYLLACNLAAA